MYQGVMNKSARLWLEIVLLVAANLAWCSDTPGTEGRQPFWRSRSRYFLACIYLNHLCLRCLKVARFSAIGWEFHGDDGPPLWLLFPTFDTSWHYHKPGNLLRSLPRKSRGLLLGSTSHNPLNDQLCPPLCLLLNIPHALSADFASYQFAKVIKHHHTIISESLCRADSFVHIISQAFSSFSEWGESCQYWETLQKSPLP